MSNPKEAVDQTRDVLNDIANVLNRHGCGLVNKDGMTVLVKIKGPGQLEAIAEIDECSQFVIKFRRFGSNAPWLIQ